MNDINKEILELTNKLRDEKPTVYKHLIENPQTIPQANKDIDKDDLILYKKTLEKLLED